MQHVDHFNTLLNDTVNLPKSRLEQLGGRVNSIYDALKRDATLGGFLTDKTPQGSWAHRTIIKPQQGKEYDADVLLHLDENEDWEDDKAQYINELSSALGRVGYANRSRMTRCVRVSYANDCHVDLVPYVLTSGTRRIVNKKTGEWEDTNPTGFTEWMNERDRITNGNFRKVVRLMKYLRDHKNSFTGTRSIILTTLLGERVDAWAELSQPGTYGNVPKTLVTIVEALNEWMQGHQEMPEVADPSWPGTTFSHRWSEASFQFFKTRLAAHAEQMRDAFDETDPTRSVEKWRDLFGDGFKKPATNDEAKSPLRVPGGAGAANLGTSAGRSGRAG